ncbi:MAG: hypothetical protein K2W99_05330 [Chthoniobacterales bacterium]|nr:hypothetical protein [Chthoniobacterales bacterium]
MDYRSAQKSLLARAHQALALGKEETALLLAQALLRSAPSFLEARGLARQAAQMLSVRQKKNKWRMFLAKGRGIFLLGKIKILMSKKEYPTALIVLEKLAGLLPDWLIVHRWMAKVALQSTPPLYELGLFAMEEVVKLAPNNIAAHLELARSALLSLPHAKPNLSRALEAYQAVLAINSDHFEAQVGMKNMLALMSIQGEFLPTENKGCCCFNNAHALG